VAGWLVVLAWHGGYSARRFAAGSDEFRAILMSAVVTSGIVGMVCCLWQIPLSRAFVLMTFLIGTPALLAERMTADLVITAKTVRAVLGSAGAY